MEMWDQDYKDEVIESHFTFEKAWLGYFQFGLVEDHIDWYDPAGYLLARSDVPENWHNLRIDETDFMLDASSPIVNWQHYV